MTDEAQMPLFATEAGIIRDDGLRCGYCSERIRGYVYEGRIWAPARSEVVGVPSVDEKFRRIWAHLRCKARALKRIAPAYITLSEEDER